MRFDHLQQLSFFVLLFATTGVFLWMLGSYLLPVFWAAVLAIVFYPLYLRIARSCGKQASLASLVTIGIVILVVLIPLITVGGMVVRESLELYQRVTQEANGPEGLSLLTRASELLTIVEPYGVSEGAIVAQLREWAANTSQFLVSSLVTVSQVTFVLFVHIGIMLYLLFFFFRDGQRLQQLLIHYLPLGDVYERRLFTRFAETARAVVKGTLAIAVLQGVLGGIAFWSVGISNPVLWGVAMGILAIIPAVGPALVWFPASVILMSTGSVFAGIIILLVGLFLVSVIDEFLRPILIGRSSKVPDSIMLLATIGGLATFGVSGFIIGPIIAAFFLTLWMMFGEHYQRELDTNN